MADKYSICDVSRNSRSAFKVNSTINESFDVKMGVHQGSVLSPLLFIMVLEALSQDHRTGLPWELLYSDNLVIAGNTITHLEDRYLTWKRRMEEKGFRVNIDKT